MDKICVKIYAPDGIWYVSSDSYLFGKRHVDVEEREKAMDCRSYAYAESLAKYLRECRPDWVVEVVEEYFEEKDYSFYDYYDF